LYEEMDSARPSDAGATSGFNSLGISRPALAKKLQSAAGEGDRVDPLTFDVSHERQVRGSTCAHRAACLTEILAFLRSFLSCLRCLSFITACTRLV